ncbi:hypothetical protein O181_006980 [Austropuccinia psidii MF-1]|uniref:Uncharacterized protein n=1 Tax=Austropuccinia psidii MF-1 TaxID=1389203 RepID=A0A9Q3BM16_9BASI|nr:hypothetical protein [Austropuccinia psidii MF-1]
MDHEATKISLSPPGRAATSNLTKLYHSNVYRPKCNPTSPISTRNGHTQVPSPTQENQNTFLRRSERIQEQSVSKNRLIIPDSPPCQIPSLAKTLYEDPLQESSFLHNLELKTSHQPIQSPRTAPITLPLNLLTPTLSLNSELENTPQIPQTSSLTLLQLKNLPTCAPQQKYPNHPNLPNVYVPKSKGAPSQASSNIPPVPQSPPESK